MTQHSAVALPSHTARTWLPWLVGVALLAAVIAVALHVAEAREFLAIAQRAKPAWLLAAVAAQCVTYLAQGEIIRDTARAGAVKLSIGTVYRASLTKLFFDQVLPSAGLSGTAAAAVQLRAAGLSQPLVASSVVLSIASYQIAYALSLTAALALSIRLGISRWLGALVLLYCVLALAWSAVVLTLAGSRRQPPKWVLRLRFVRELLQFLAAAERRLSRSPLLLALASMYQLVIVIADACTLWVLIYALGGKAPATAVFTSFMLSNVLRTLGMVPGGLGTFEAASVWTLSTTGVPVALALAATLLFRALSFWLPMPFGFWFYQHTLRQQHNQHGDRLNPDTTRSAQSVRRARSFPQNRPTPRASRRR